MYTAIRVPVGVSYIKYGRWSEEYLEMYEIQKTGGGLPTPVLVALVAGSNLAQRVADCLNATEDMWHPDLDIKELQSKSKDYDDLADIILVLADKVHDHDHL